MGMNQLMHCSYRKMVNWNRWEGIDYQERFRPSLYWHRWARNPCLQRLNVLLKTGKAPIW